MGPIGERDREDIGARERKIEKMVREGKISKGKMVRLGETMWKRERD